MQELTILERTDKSLTIEFKGENETLLNILKQRLLANDKVDSATYLMGHPLIDAPRLVFSCTSGKPEQHLRAAAKDLRAEFDDLETQLLKA